MDIVSRWLEERTKKKSVTEPRNQTTSTSSPTRGANQDYSGVGVKNDTADYTISDEHKHKNLDTPAHSPEWETETRATRKAISKHLVKKTAKGVYGEETINELISGVGNVRIKPVNMAHQSGKEKSANAPSNVYKMQSAADTRVAQLDRAAQQQKDQAEKERERQTAEREKAAAQRQKESEQQRKQQTKESVMKSFKDFVTVNEQLGTMKNIKAASQAAATRASDAQKLAAAKLTIQQEKDSKKAQKQNEEYVDEARGRPKKDDENPNTGNGRDPRKHIQVAAGEAMGRGSVEFTHNNGQKSTITAQHGKKIVAHLASLKPADRQATVNKMHDSPEGLKV
jgi:hypothetical protein